MANPMSGQQAELPLGLSIVPSRDLGAARTMALRQLLLRAYDDFTEFNWQHAGGGTHVLIEQDAAILAHAAVVARRITFDERAFRAGYVEAVAVDPAHQGHGLGSKVMAAVAEIIDTHFQLGVLSTESVAFYARLGWTVWTGPSAVRRADGWFRSLDDDGGIMVRSTALLAILPPTATIGCDDRAGDAW